ncbi:Hypothetical predicted protein [Marmota monax]|uniref:Uncharacterized protein n=1 Tax=Marmota monax TaxID=9995 RepID=A0A5E4BPX7_MARMO|nr:hypothetical protein GHT09_004866 [Marmota monax]VTJ71617.1 Hypothetical predicted protein [Marmota monax]
MLIINDTNGINITHTKIPYTVNTSCWLINCLTSAMKAKRIFILSVPPSSPASTEPVQRVEESMGHGDEESSEGDPTPSLIITGIIALVAAITATATYTALLSQEYPEFSRL